MNRFIVIFLSLSLLSACSERTDLAPVEELRYFDPPPTFTRPPALVKPQKATIIKSAKDTKSVSNHSAYTPPNAWLWPIQGPVVTSFIPQQGKKGIDIAGRQGDLVHAAASGVVAYAGNGLNGYGNLIIIKHNDQYLTAYGYNKTMKVVEGQRIKVGQVIAEIGLMDKTRYGLHFEIRHAGQPVNPLSLLKH